VIGSVSEFQQQMAEQERRRQQAAGQQAAAPVTNSEPVTAVPFAAAMPAAGCSPAPMAVKAAEPDVAKRRKKHHDRIGRDLETDPVDAGAQEAAKSFEQRGVHAGPGEGTMPGHPQPAQFDRGYLEAGHAAESPQAEPARQNPMPMMHHRVLPDQPMAAAIPQHVIDTYTMRSPSDK
jgi:hypothetical protein